MQTLTTPLVKAGKTASADPLGLCMCWQGVIVYFRVVDGRLRAGDDIRLMNTEKHFEVLEVGVLAPKPVIVGPPAAVSCHGGLSNAMWHISIGSGCQSPQCQQHFANV